MKIAFIKENRRHFRMPIRIDSGEPRRHKPPTRTTIGPSRDVDVYIAISIKNTSSRSYLLDEDVCRLWHH
nr:MAG TPA: hypothetical protein [Caudoviricetes sp.]